MKKIAVIGLGYVGLPLAHAFAEKGMSVIGYDINVNRIKELSDGIDETLELSAEQLKVVSERLKFTSELADIEASNVYIITVPTPIDKRNKPDLTPLINASKLVGKVLTNNDLVIYESTVYPGVTEDVCVPELEYESGLTYNKDFYCGYSPERINPGDKVHTLKNILKVTSGSTPEVANEVDSLYKTIIEAGTHKASSIKVAEASKVIENTQRDVNIALINELALIFDTMDINTHEVLEAASTKWNFINLKPGLVGGHCIGVDPYYLTFKAEELGYKPNLILGARQINNGMGAYIAEKTIKKIIDNDKKVKFSKVLILGATFKENCPDMRNTKVIDICNVLNSYGCDIDIYEPWLIKENKLDSEYNFIDSPFKNSQKYDAIVIAVNHSEFEGVTMSDLASISTNNPVIIDVKGTIKDATWSL